MKTLDYSVNINGFFIINLHDNFQVKEERLRQDLPLLHVIFYLPILVIVLIYKFQDFNIHRTNSTKD